MSDNYYMEDFIELLEKQIKRLENPMECPFSMDPYKEGEIHRKAQQSILNWVIEMLPANGYKENTNE